MWIALSLALVAGGYYDGVCAGGQISLHLAADGTAVYGGARFRWTQPKAPPGEGPTRLVLTGADGQRLELAVGVGPRGRITLDGPPFGRVWLTPLDVPEAAPGRPTVAEIPLAPPPPGASGRWRHTANGGALTLELKPSGTFRMIQSFRDPIAPAPSPPRVTAGRWGGRAGSTGALILTPDGGRPLEYRFRVDQGRLLVQGGDLPTEVGFDRVVDVPEEGPR